MKQTEFFRSGFLFSSRQPRGIEFIDRYVIYEFN